MVNIELVASRRDLKQFIEYPYAKYRHDPTWVPPLLIGEWEKFDHEKNPFFEHARMELFLAKRGGQVVGRVAAIDDDNHNATHGDNLLFFGFFEAVDEAVTGALLEAVEATAKKLGRSAVRGPTNPTMNDGSGFQIDAFDTTPYVLMPQNPPEYPRFVEAHGYLKVKDLYAWLFDAQEGATERLTRLADRVRKRYQPVVRTADMKQLDREAALLKEIYNNAWEKNWGFVKYTDAEFDHLIQELKLILDPDLALFIELDGKTAGVAIGIPDINQVLMRVRGRLLPFGIFYLLARKRFIERARLPILGLMPAFRNRGLELVLIDEIARRGAAKGFKQGECSWVLEDNHAMNKGCAAAGATLYKTYRLYQKTI